MKKKSFAKINLMLNVVERREDGYHDLEMIIVPIDLFDTIDIKISKKTKMKSNKRYIPNDNRNTVIKAINILREKYDFDEQFNIKLVKNTPTRGGMGGGSSNGALIIKMLNEMLDLQMTFDEMMEVAEAVGTDVPFTLFGKPAIVKGVGEKVKEINLNLEFFLFIVKPSKGVSTPLLFKNIDIDALQHYDANRVKEALETGDYESFVQEIGNSLEESAIESVPEISTIKKELMDFGFDAAIMSGAGSTVFGVTQDEDLVNRAVTHFYKKYDFVKKSRIIRDVKNEELIS